MTKFRQKNFSEHTAMNFFYSKLMELGGERKKWPIISKSSLLPILRGNNVVIEKFTIVDSWFGGDKYRMYIKVGEKAVLPEDVRMPRGRGYDQSLGNVKLSFSNPGLKEFSHKNKDNKGGGGQQQQQGGGSFGKMYLEGGPNVALNYKVKGEVLGKTIDYNKETRSLVLEFNRINDAIECLNYLPFGFGYRIYILDSK